MIKYTMLKKQEERKKVKKRRLNLHEKKAKNRRSVTMRVACYLKHKERRGIMTRYLVEAHNTREKKRRRDRCRR
jgi:hypothetical protein